MSKLGFTVEGKLDAIKNTEEKGAKNFKVREFILEVDDNGYTQHLKLELAGDDKVSLLDKYSVGDFVKASVNIGGRKWNDTAFNSLRCWKLEGDASDPLA